MNWRTLLSTMLLLAAVAASWLLVNQPLPESLTPATGTTTTPQEIGYYARDATVVGTQEDGSLLYKLNAREITHYPHDNSIVLHEVDLSYHPDTGVPWTLQSEVGRLPGTGDEIQLSGDVRVISHPESEADRADTSALEFSNTQWTFTGNVVISTEGTRIDADEAHMSFVDYKLVSVVVTGGPATFEQETIIDEEKKITRGRAGIIDYDVSNGILQLKSDAWINQGANEISGNVLRYDIPNERIVADSDSEGTQRVHITIVPPEEETKEDNSSEPEQ